MYGWFEWLRALIEPYGSLINVVSTLVIAIFTLCLFRVAWRQTKDARVLQRAYLDAQFDGIHTNTDGELLGRVVFKNVGHLPATKVYWCVKLDYGGEDWRPRKISRNGLMSESTIPKGAEWPQGSAGVPPPQDLEGLYVYVWGRIAYLDGFGWRKRRLDFCHRYPWAKREEAATGTSISRKYARYHDVGNWAD